MQSGKAAYAAGMAILRHMIIGLLAIAVSVGTGWQSCASLQFRLSPVAPIEHTASHQSQEHHQHAHGHDQPSNERVAVKADKIQPKNDDHACVKCCGACMLTSLLPLAAQWTIFPVASAISFAILSEQLQGRVVYIDPDIPKHIV